MRFTTPIAIVASMLALNANTVEAWGAVGHTLTGQIAQQYLTSTTAKVVNTLLSDYEGLLGNVAPWADKVRFLSQY
ncbi:hypothetical protein BGX20_006358, partial [Mortierella sp. AD010]